MKKPLIIIFAITIIIVVCSFVVYKLIDNYEVTIELNEKVIKVNMYDEVDLNSYIKKIVDNNGNKITDNIAIAIDCDNEDIHNNNTLIIKGTGVKEITYSIKKFWKTYSNSLVIVVVTDPNDPDFNPNYSKINKEIEINSNEIPSKGGNSSLTKTQLEYLNSLQY